MWLRNIALPYAWFGVLAGRHDIGDIHMQILLQHVTATIVNHVIVNTCGREIGYICYARIMYVSIPLLHHGKQSHPFFTLQLSSYSAYLPVMIFQKIPLILPPETLEVGKKCLYRWNYCLLVFPIPTEFSVCIFISVHN